MAFFSMKMPNVVTEFIIVDDPGITCDPVTSMSGCEAAAQYLGLSDTSAMEHKDLVIDPPYCYIDENDDLCFNGDASNTGNCGENDDQCLCKGSGTSTTLTTTTGEQRNVALCNGLSVLQWI